MTKRFVLRVVLYEDDTSGTLVALLDTLHAAGAIETHRASVDEGALIDIYARDREHAEQLRNNLTCWHINSRVVQVEDL